MSFRKTNFSFANEQNHPAIKYAFYLAFGYPSLQGALYPFLNPYPKSNWSLLGFICVLNCAFR